MKTFDIYKFTSLFLVFGAITSFFLGFYLDENSAGAGSYEGDFEDLWNNLQIFLNNELLTSIQHPEYDDSRSPIAYILHEIFNPYTESKINFRRSVFFISFLLPISFYFCLKIKFKNSENLLLILISSIILLSPYFRTSAYWGLEENYGLITLVLTYLFYSSFKNEKGNFVNFNYIKLFALIFLSCLCFYFDQKLLFIPIFCFIKIIFSNKSAKLKLFSTFLFFLFALPYIYLILLWGSIIPPGAAADRRLGDNIFWDQLGFASTIISFYLIPLFLLKKESIIVLIKNIFLYKKNYIFIFVISLYVIYLLLFFEFNLNIAGNGIINKISFLLFEGYFRTTFLLISFFFSLFIVLVYFNKNFVDFLIIFYFFILSLFLYPIFQEYFDPLIIILVFTFFSSKIYPTYKNSIILFIYFSIFLTGSNIYYYNLLK